jgi:mono/diheme cytochrome c family protein
MKNSVKLLLSIAMIAAFVFACTNQEPLKPVSTGVEAQTYRSKGVVKKTNVGKGEITISHEEIPGYMSPMEMTVPVKGRAALETVKVGDMVDFELERTGEELIIIGLNKIGEVAALSGAEIYKTNCASCHGDKGEGAEKGIPLTSGHALHHSEAEHIKQVTDGEVKKMPAFRGKLSAEEIKAVVDFVRSDLQKDQQRDDSHNHKH